MANLCESAGGCTSPYVWESLLGACSAVGYLSSLLLKDLTASYACAALGGIVGGALTLIITGSGDSHYRVFSCFSEACVAFYSVTAISSLILAVHPEQIDNTVKDVACIIGCVLGIWHTLLSCNARRRANMPGPQRLLSEGERPGNSPQPEDLPGKPPAHSLGRRTT